MFNKKIAKSEDAALALNAALRLLTRREYSLYELKVKLLPRFTHDAVNTALTKCINEGWQSEKRCAQMLLRHCVFSYYGPLKLSLLARQKARVLRQEGEVALEAGDNMGPHKGKFRVCKKAYPGGCAVFVPFWERRTFPCEFFFKAVLFLCSCKPQGPEAVEQFFKHGLFLALSLKCFAHAFCGISHGQPLLIQIYREKNPGKNKSSIVTDKKKGTRLSQTGPFVVQLLLDPGLHGLDARRWRIRSSVPFPPRGGR